MELYGLPLFRQKKAIRLSCVLVNYTIIHLYKVMVRIVLSQPTIKIKKPRTDSLGLVWSKWSALLPFEDFFKFSYACLRKSQHLTSRLS